ncbi:MAG: hypothetical protein P1U77_26240, partial [Rubripirellula sp.]|nr:hypothetical protein [Rubripirellula sp.]
MSEMKPLVIITLLFALVPGPGWASEESESLSLLVKTLENTKDPNIRAALMRGMLSGLAGRRDVSPPEGWGKVSRELAKSEVDETRELSMQLSQIFGDSDAIQRALMLVKDDAAEPRLRRIA